MRSSYSLAQIKERSVVPKERALNLPNPRRIDMARIRKAVRCLTDWFTLRISSLVPTPELDDFQIEPEDVIADLAYGRD